MYCRIEKNALYSKLPLPSSKSDLEAEILDIISLSPCNSVVQFCVAFFFFFPPPRAVINVLVYLGECAHVILIGLQLGINGSDYYWFSQGSKQWKNLMISSQNLAAILQAQVVLETLDKLPKV